MHNEGFVLSPDFWPRLRGQECSVSFLTCFFSCSHSLEHQLPGDWIDENISQINLEDWNTAYENNEPSREEMRNSWNMYPCFKYETTPVTIKEEVQERSWEPEVSSLIQTTEKSLAYAPGLVCDAVERMGNEVSRSCAERKVKHRVRRGVPGASHFVERKFSTTFKEGRPRLCQFLYELLSMPEKYSRIVEWLDENQGVFKFVNSSEVAQMWGRRRNKPHMKYENFARSLRTYISRGILHKPRNKLVYQFAKSTVKALIKPKSGRMRDCAL